MLCVTGLVGQGTEPGQRAAMPCPAPGNILGAFVAFLSSSFQVIHLSTFAPCPGKGMAEGGMVWKGCLWVSADRWVSALLSSLLLQPSTIQAKKTNPRSHPWQFRQ